MILKINTSIIQFFSKFLFNFPYHFSFHVDKNKEYSK